MFHVKQILSIFFISFSFSVNAQKTIMFQNLPNFNPAQTNEIVLNWNESQTGFQSLSPVEKEFYYWVNYSRLYPSRFLDSVIMPIVKANPQLKGENLESLKKELNSTNSLVLLGLSEPLIKMASYQAENITSNNAKPSHTSVNGETFPERFKRFNLKNCGGENISYGAPGISPVFMLAILYLDIGVADLGHRKSLLNQNFTLTGISAKTYRYGNIFIVEDFACTQN